MGYEIVFSPAECDAHSCHDDMCPYIHSPMWQFRLPDGTLSDGYHTEEKCETDARIHKIRCDAIRIEI